MSELTLAGENGSISRLARAGAEDEISELLAFVSDGELYAVELHSVHEIVIPPPITMVPRSPPAVLGVCSVRGELATVVDLRIVLDLPAVLSDKKRILLARVGGVELVGLLVDEVRQVVRLKAAQVELSSQGLGGEMSEAVRGVGRPSADEVIVILDLVSVLAKGCR